ncbi:hypothetical protein Tco_0536037 [Tanacetum coccineum]
MSMHHVAPELTYHATSSYCTNELEEPSTESFVPDPLALLPTLPALQSFFMCPVIMENLVKDSKRHAFWSLNEDILKITVLKTNTPYPSRKYGIWNQYNILEDIKRGLYSKKPPIRHEKIRVEINASMERVDWPLSLRARLGKRLSEAHPLIPKRVPYNQRNNPPQHSRIVYPPILKDNYFRHFLDILRNYDPMDDEPMWAADRVIVPTLGSAITIPKTANEFAIKGNHLTLVKGNQFDGRTKTDPHKHIHEFLDL